MFGVDATSDAAEMVHLKLIGDGSDEQQIGGSVSGRPAATDAETAVSTAVHIARP